MSLAGGIGLMLGGFALCYASTKDKFDQKTQTNKFEITPDSPLNWLQPLRDAFQAPGSASSAPNDGTLRVGNGQASA